MTPYNESEILGSSSLSKEDQFLVQLTRIANSLERIEQQLSPSAESAAEKARIESTFYPRVDITLHDIGDRICSELSRWRRSTT